MCRLMGALAPSECPQRRTVVHSSVSKHSSAQNDLWFPPLYSIPTIQQSHALLPATNSINILYTGWVGWGEFDGNQSVIDNLTTKGPGETTDVPHIDNCAKFYLVWIFITAKAKVHLGLAKGH